MEGGGARGGVRGAGSPGGGGVVGLKQLRDLLPVLHLHLVDDEHPSLIEPLAIEAVAIKEAAEQRAAHAHFRFEHWLLGERGVGIGDEPIRVLADR